MYSIDQKRAAAVYAAERAKAFALVYPGRDPTTLSPEERLEAIMKVSGPGDYRRPPATCNELSRLYEPELWPSAKDQKDECCPDEGDS